MEVLQVLKLMLKGSGARRTVHVLALATIWSFALALPAIWDDFRLYYKPEQGSELARAECLTCHVRKGQRAHNAYGTDVLLALDKSRGQATMIASFVAVEMFDSDGDGWSNGEEIRAGFLPGDPQSHPPGEPSYDPVSKDPATAGTGAQASPGVIPTHSFHPQIVHFPIALFIFGALLDFVGLRRGSASMRKAGYWNLLAGASISLLAVPTGLLAAFREGYGLNFGTPVFLHFLLAVASVLGMFAIAFWRKRHEPASTAYFIVLFAVAALVGAASHFGGDLVYGDR